MVFILGGWGVVKTIGHYVVFNSPMKLCEVIHLICDHCNLQSFYVLFSQEKHHIPKHMHL